MTALRTGSGAGAVRSPSYDPAHSQSWCGLQMQGWRVALAVIGSLVAANGALWWVLARNLTAHVYPTNADSIAILMFEGLLVSTLILLPVLVALWLPRSRRVWRGLRLRLAVLSALLALSYAESWTVLHHYAAAPGFVAVALVCGWIAGSARMVALSP